MRSATLALAAVAAMFGQSAMNPPAFEVASVKAVPAASGKPLDFRTYPGGRLEVTNLTLKSILQLAYGVKGYQLTGGPAWLDTDRFDIVAKASGDASRAELLAMLQTLLADRFQLKVHRESKESNVYALVVGKNGPKLKESTAGQSYVRLYRKEPPDQPGVHYTIDAQKVSMALLAERLGGEWARPVLDRTGIQGEFDFKLDYSIDENPDSALPSSARFRSSWV
jgi:uncharacterized protein (TIGR03435 family)